MIFKEVNRGSTDLTLDQFEFRKALKHRHVKANFILKLKLKDIESKFKEVSGNDGLMSFDEFSH